MKNSYGEEHIIAKNLSIFDTQLYQGHNLPLGFVLCFSDDDCTNAFKGRFGESCPDCKKGITKVKNRLKKQTEENAKLSSKTKKYISQFNFKAKNLNALLIKKGVFVELKKDKPFLSYKIQKRGCLSYTLSFRGDFLSDDDFQWLDKMFDEIISISKSAPQRTASKEQIKAFKDRMEQAKLKYCQPYDVKNDSYLEQKMEKKKAITAEKSKIKIARKYLTYYCDAIKKARPDIDIDNLLIWQLSEYTIRRNCYFSIVAKFGKNKKVGLQLLFDMSDERLEHDFFIKVLERYESIYNQKEKWQATQLKNKLKKVFEKELEQGKIVMNLGMFKYPKEALEKAKEGKR